MFAHLPFVRAGISNRADGPMKLLGEAALDESALRHRADFFATQDIDPRTIITAGLVHGTKIVTVNLEEAGEFISATDGLITNAPGVVLSVTVADCAPIFVIDPVHRAIGLAHAGWRGTADGIITALIRTMMAEFSTNPMEVLVEIGPHLQLHHFEIQADVAARFREIPGAIRAEGEKLLLDLSAAYRFELEGLRIPASQTVISEECTYCHSGRYFSYRRDRPTQVEAMIAYLEIRKE